MRNRHPTNGNLTLHYDPEWQGMPVFTGRGPLIHEYLERIDQVINLAVEEHPRTFAFRVDLKFPKYYPHSDQWAISRFIESLKAKIHADRLKKGREGKRVHACHLRFVWVRERNESLNWHYHLCLLLSNDAYHTLGWVKPRSTYTAWTDRMGFASEQQQEKNMMDRVREAWASALRLSMDEVMGLVHVPKDPCYKLDANRLDYWEERERLFHRLSYLAKMDTKDYGDGRNNFGMSRR